MSEIEIVQLLRHERKRRGLSLRDVSEMSGVRPATICEIESGKSYGNFKTIMSLIGSLGFTMYIEKVQKTK